MFRRVFGFLMAVVIGLIGFTGCGGNGGEFEASKEIGVISRETGSGTRGAFIELLGIEQKDENGEKFDYTADHAVITDSTSVMLTTVAGDMYAIGYASLGSLNETVKAVEVNGASISVENIKSGEYKIARPFNIAVRDDLNKEAQDFIDFILSTDGQKVIEENDYIAIANEETKPYNGSMSSGKIVVAGSSSITPVMEKLKEAYNALNPNVVIVVQQSDSSTGMKYAINGTCDIGMASRELKESELSEGIRPIVIAMDGIAIIVNNDCPVDALTSDNIRRIFIGEIASWSEIVG